MAESAAHRQAIRPQSCFTPLICQRTEPVESGELNRYGTRLGSSRPRVP